MAVITIVCKGISVMNTVKCDAYENCTAILNHFYDNTLSCWAHPSVLISICGTRPNLQWLY